LTGTIDFLVAQVGQTDRKDRFRSSVSVTVKNIGAKSSLGSLDKRQQKKEARSDLWETHFEGPR
jgi:hypothetical protein